MVAYLEGAAEAEDAVVGLLGREALDGLENDVGLLGDEVIGSVNTNCQINVSPLTFGGGLEGGSLPQPELSVAGGVGVPVGEGGEEALEEGALEHVGGERWLGHDDGSRWGWCFGCVGSRRRSSSSSSWIGIWHGRKKASGWIWD